MAPSPAEQQLEIGAVVKLKGLVAAAKHNGCHGELLRFDEEKGRWAVKLQSDLSVLGVKPENLVFIRAGKPKQDTHSDDDDDEEERRLGKLKRNFDRVVRKYNLASRSDEIADLLTGGDEKISKIGFKDIAERYGMEMDDAIAFLTWIQAAVNFKETALDPHTAQAEQTAAELASKDPELAKQLKDAAAAKGGQ